MNTQRIHAWREGSIPTVDPDDLKSAWNFQEKVRALKGELTKPGDVSVAFELFQRSFKPDETNHNVNYRNAVLIQMIYLSEMGLAELTKLGLAGMKVLPGVDNGKPSDAMLKAIAKIPMKAENRFPPFDMEELRSLIEKEKGSHLH
jgi:hypothetical protein